MNTPPKLIKTWTKIAILEHREIYGAYATDENRNKYVHHRVEQFYYGYEQRRKSRLEEIEDEDKEKLYKRLDKKYNI